MTTYFTMSERNLTVLQGLKVNYIRELHKGVQEIFNPFPTIAVWAAVKFVHKKEQNRF